MKFTLKQMIYTALMAAFVFVATLVIQVPVPMTNGYIHLGDSVIFLSAMLLGPIGGAFAAGIGSSLADVLGGYAHWAPATFIIKFLMGLITGYLMPAHREKFRTYFAMLIGGLWMCFGYYVASAFMYGSWVAPIFSIPWNILQFTVGAVLAATAAVFLEKAPLSH
ncbi:MAG: hypothetical protein PWQ12_86 [Clostridiales bacterium]|jgi:uncharacterized membrane protein|nr:hypothetical protein [Clostridiales bacterium]